MAAVERYTLRELDSLIKEGKKYRLFKPFFYNGQILFNIEKVLNEKDILRLEGKIYGPIEVVPAVEHTTDDKIRNAVIENCIKILKKSSLFHIDDVRHLEFVMRKECEKLFTGILSNSPHVAQKVLEIFQFSKKLFLHSVNVAIISTVIDLGMQNKKKMHNALRSEELLVAALLHDVGFLNLPVSLVEKRRVEYTEEEKKLYLTYPEESKKIASTLGDNIRSKTIDVIYQHQERLTGQGFPQHLKGTKIEDMALVIGLADEFDLLISKETAEHQRTISEAMSRFSRYGQIIGNDIVDSFYTWFRYLK